MQAELIIIGNELLNGKIQDRNTHFLAKGLLNKGIKLRKTQIVPDGSCEFEQILKEGLERSKYIFLSGGLGPTQDDVTKNMLAKFFNYDLVENEKAYKQAKIHYDRGQRVYDKELIHYHILPKEFSVLPNPVGYAPGIFYEHSGVKIFALPGVPSELQSMLENIILPNYISEPEQIIEHITFKTWGAPESKIFTEIAPNLWDKLEGYGQVSSLPHLTGVDIGVTLTAKSQDEITSKKKEITKIIEATELRSYLWHIGNESIEEIIIAEAKEKNLKIGFAESCTGGLCGHRITNYSGSSAVFWGSIVSYANEVKMKSLSVSEQTLKDHGAVSLETAKEMAIGAREQLQVDITVTTTGIAGPGGGSEEKPVGTVGIGVATSKEAKSRIYHPKGDRATLKQRFSDLALMSMLKAIRSYEAS